MGGGGLCYIAAMPAEESRVRISTRSPDCSTWLSLKPFPKSHACRERREADLRGRKGQQRGCSTRGGQKGLNPPPGPTAAMGSAPPPRCPQTGALQDGDPRLPAEGFAPHIRPKFPLFQFQTAPLLPSFTSGAPRTPCSPPPP